jgi:hypothetical protein
LAVVLGLFPSFHIAQGDASHLAFHERKLHITRKIFQILISIVEPDADTTALGLLSSRRLGGRGDFLGFVTYSDLCIAQGQAIDVERLLYSMAPM